jgi:hypothetical protein
MLAVGRDRFPDKIIVQAEPPYEGHGGTNGPDIQRYAFWSAILSGARGFTYGAAGIFQANDRERPTGGRPDTGAYDAVFWDESMLLPGAGHLAAGHRFLQSLPFHRFQPHPEWAEATRPHGGGSKDIPFRTFAAGIPGECRLIYIPLRMHKWDGPRVKGLDPGVRYRAAYVETNTMKRHELGEVFGDGDGDWQAPMIPHMYDWLLVLQRA